MDEIRVPRVAYDYPFEFTPDPDDEPIKLVPTRESKEEEL